jgi:hypothetical protein
MLADDRRYTYNELSNEDKELLLSHGYVPNELQPDEAQDLLQDLREEIDGDSDSERVSDIGDERDGSD